VWQLDGTMVMINEQKFWKYIRNNESSFKMLSFIWTIFILAGYRKGKKLQKCIRVPGLGSQGDFFFNFWFYAKSSEE
jgi:hypothetical protein